MGRWMKENPAVAVIILNWNGLDDTLACVRSLQRSSYTNHEIVVVDNGSDGDEGKRFLSIFPQIQLIQNPTNRGFAGGNNDGIRWAMANGFDYVVNLNNDCIVAADWLEKLVSGLQASGADFASSQIRYYPETHLICSDEDRLLPDGSGLAVNHLKTAEGNEPMRPIFGASGAASVYSVACLESVKVMDNQYFDELFFAYLEDIDLGIRLNVKGFKGVSIPDAVVYHKGSQTSGYRTRFQMFHLEKNRILVELLTYPLFLIPVGEAFYWLKTLTRMLLKGPNQGQRRYAMGKSESMRHRLKLLVDSRLWVWKSLSRIWQHRKDRDRRGLIDGKVHRFFVWKFTQS